MLLESFRPDLKAMVAVDQDRCMQVRVMQKVEEDDEQAAGVKAAGVKAAGVKLGAKGPFVKGVVLTMPCCDADGGSEEDPPVDFLTR